MCYEFIWEKRSDLCHLHRKLIGFYNQDEKCLQRGTDGVFKLNSLPFVFKGLNKAFKGLNKALRTA